MWCLLAFLACGGDTPPVDAAGTDEGSDSPSEATPSNDTGPADGATPGEDTGQVADAWDNFAAPFFATYCVACHDTSPKDFTVYADVVAFAVESRCGIASGEVEGCGPGLPAPGQFPPGAGPKPTPEERARLVSWIDAGLPR